LLDSLIASCSLAGTQQAEEYGSPVYRWGNRWDLQARQV